MIGSGTMFKIFPTVLASGAIGAIGVPSVDTVDWTMAIAVSLGLIFGMLWRAGHMMKSEIGSKPIIKDLIVSLMISGVNLILSLIIINVLNIAPNPLYYMGVGALIATMGTSAIVQVQEMYTSYMKSRYK